MEPEFDRYADNYRELMRDPIRDAFAAGSDFFHARKWRLLRDFFERRGTVAKGARWLGIWAGKGEVLRLRSETPSLQAQTFSMPASGGFSGTSSSGGAL